MDKFSSQYYLLKGTSIDQQVKNNRVKITVDKGDTADDNTLLGTSSVVFTNGFTSTIGT